MIKNERQYRITKSQLAEFEATLKRMKNTRTADVHPRLAKAQIDAVMSQCAELESAIMEYEALQQKRPSVIESHSLEELPRALIRARIALGLSQKDLAAKMGLKEQQLQRYEATEYASASLARIREVADALGVRVSESVFLPSREPNRDALYSRLDSAGIDDQFLIHRLLPSEIATGLENEPPESQGLWALRAGHALKRIFGWDVDDIFGIEPLAIRNEATATARFKLPAGAHARRLHAYIAYAHYLGMVVANATPKPSPAQLLLDPKQLQIELAARDPQFSLEAVLNYFWDKGVPVLPLSDQGAFHGATWRIAGKNVIVVKQRSRFLSRWVFDLLHEWHHAAQSPDDPNHSWIEEAELASTRRTSPEEQAASRFAGDVLLGGNAEMLVKRCLLAAKTNIAALKNVVPTIAKQSSVVVDHLANYIAWRLSLQQQNWWGAANNLQSQTGDPFHIARDVFYRRFDFSLIDPIDARLLERALQTEGDSYG